MPSKRYRLTLTVEGLVHIGNGNKKSREQFELSSYKRLIDIYSSTSQVVDALMKLELPSGVSVEIKI